MAHDQVLVVGKGRLQFGQRRRRAQMGVLLVEVSGIDVARFDPFFDLCQFARQVEAEGTPLLADGPVERAQASAEGLHQAGEVGSPHRVGGVAPRQRLGHQDGRAVQLLQRDHPGTGRYGAAQTMRSDSARNMGERPRSPWRPWRSAPRRPAR